MTRQSSTIILIFSTVFILYAPAVSDARLPTAQSAEATADWQSIAYQAYAGTDRYKLAEKLAPTSAPKKSPVAASPPTKATSPQSARSPPAFVAPSKAPSRSPASKSPSKAPSKAPTKAPSNAPGQAPGMAPAGARHPPIVFATPTPPAPLVPTFGTPPTPPLLTYPPAPITLSAPPPVFGFQKINDSSTARSSAVASCLDVYQMLVVFAAAILGASAICIA